ncbi:MAG: OmpA family protein [Cyclobacteriaceae bacterium]|nr:OmpA family protein [Cyclobacteriaceae bacterium]
MNLRKIYLTIAAVAVALISYSQNPANQSIQDKFDDNRNGWWLGETGGGSQSIHDGKMFLDIPEGGWIITIYPYVEFEKDFVTEVSLRQTEGHEDNGVGLSWAHSKPENTQNYFIITANGYYYIYNASQDKSKTVKGINEWIKTTLIKPLNEVNTIKVEQVGNTLNYYINNQKVTSTDAFRWKGSGIGLVSYTKMKVEADDYSFAQKELKINLPTNLTKGLVKENMGDAINTASSDLMPIITADGRNLYFGRQDYEGNLGGVADGEDYYLSTWDGTKWSKAQNLGAPINTPKVDNYSSVSTDNNTILFVDSKEFWSISRNESGWGAPKPIGLTFVNEAKHFESYLAPNGKSIIFTAKNVNNLFYDKGEDERDFYVSLQDKNGKWSDPINMGPKINTRRDEISPFLAADDRTLYFSTTGRAGYGNGDIFMSKRIGDGWTNWTEPVNLGPEINSPSFDAYYVVPASGEYAYMVSNQGGFGKSDIIRVKLVKELQPDPVVLVRGRTLDAKTKQPISANILIDNLTTNKEVGEAVSEPKNGSYQITLPYGANYGFHAAALGHLSVNENLELTTISKYTEIEKDLYLLPIIAGQVLQLNNVFFEQAKPVLKPESYAELDRLITIMQENPTMEIELGGYTDNVGREVSLILLSMDRAGAVKKYMVSKGIAQKRITGKGYGPANPVVKNDTEEHRRMNRRVEFKITKK